MREMEMQMHVFVSTFAMVKIALSPQNFSCRKFPSQLQQLQKIALACVYPQCYCSVVH